MRRCVSAAKASSAALGIDAFASAATSAGTRARFSRMTRRAAGGRGSLADSMTVTSIGQPPLDDFRAVAEIPPDLHGVVLQLDQFLEIRDLRDTQLLGTPRTDLGRVTVDGLPAAEDGILAANRANRLGQDIARGQRIAGGRTAIGEQDGLSAPRKRQSRSTSAALGGPIVSAVTVPP